MGRRYTNVLKNVICCIYTTHIYVVYICDHSQFPRVASVMSRALCVRTMLQRSKGSMGGWGDALYCIQPSKIPHNFLYNKGYSLFMN